MPIFEYRCEKCGTVNEILQLRKDEQFSCKECGSSNLTKLMSAPNISMGGQTPSFSPPPGGCCGDPNSCDTPGRCCGG